MLDWLIDLARRSGHRFMVRLVKGAYWDSEIKRAQVDGQAGYPVYTRKVYTDVAYLACAKKLLAAQDAIFPQFATHNAYSLAAVHELGRGKDWEFQCLHGMGETLYDEVVGRGRRWTAPAASMPRSAPTRPCWPISSGACSRTAPTPPSSTGWSTPRSRSTSWSRTRSPWPAPRLGGRPYGRIPLPRELYGAVRPNSKGIDLVERARPALAAARARGEHARRSGPPARSSAAASGYDAATALPIRNPADHADHVVGTVREADTTDVDVALGIAGRPRRRAGPRPRSPTGPPASSAPPTCMEAEMPALIGARVREAGKSLPNAVAEVREAVDFCRYYAAQIRAEFRNNTHRKRLGPVVCIAPWNFPLAIFVGEVARRWRRATPCWRNPPSRPR